jgi:nuclear pore complex protein Nup98-Nup96
MWRGVLLNEDDRLRDHDITSSDTLLLVIDEAAVKENTIREVMEEMDSSNVHTAGFALTKPSPERHIERGRTAKSSVNKELWELPPAEMVPKLERQGYILQPPIRQLSRMTEEELSHVRGFTISNEHGKVEFEGTVDVRYLDLDEIISIKPRELLMYPEDKFVPAAEYAKDPAGRRPKPDIGTGLNRPAIVSLYNCFPSPQTQLDDRQFQAKLENQCRRMGSMFLGYDPRSGEWRQRVQHF